MDYNNIKSTLNITSIFYNEFYLNISLKNFENNTNLYTRIIQDNFSEIDELLCLQRDGIENYNSGEIVEMFGNTNETKCDDYYLSIDNITIITNRKKSDIMYIKIKFKKPANNTIKKNNIYISLFKEDIIEFESEKYVQKISKCYGFYFILNLTKYGNNFGYLIYSNVSKSMKVYGLTQEEKNNFKFNETTGRFLDFTKILSLNSEKIKNLTDYIIFIDKTIKEDFSFIILQINNSEDSISVNNYLNQKKEIIDFKALKDENEKPMKYIIMSYIYPKINNVENYFYFYEEISGTVHAQIFDLDNNIYLDEKNNKYDPQIIPEYNSVLIILNTTGDYKYKSYSLKCLNYNDIKINYGDNIQICLNPREVTNLYIQSSSKYLIKLLINEKTDIQYSIKIKLSIEDDYYFINNTNKEFYREEPRSKYYISLINDGIYTTIVNFKLSLNDSNKYNYIEQSIDETIVENEKLYVLLLPKYFENGETNSVYQELNFKGENSELCFVFDTNKYNIISYPPKNSCFNYSNEIYNFNLTLIENNTNDYYIYLYLKKKISNSVSLNYKHVLVYSGGMTESLRNNITNNKNIFYIKFINYQNNSLLFLQIIKENKINSQIQITSKYIDKNNKVKFKNIKNLKHNQDELLLTNIIELSDSPAETNPYLKLTSLQNLYVYFKFSSNISEFSFKEIEDNSLSVELDNVKNEYILNFNPMDEEGTAYYKILLIEEATGLPLEKLSNPYFLINLNFNYTKEASSINSVFDEETKNYFKISVTKNNANFYIALLAQRTYPVSYKIYIPFYTKIINTRYEFINLTEITNISNYSIDLVLNETEQQLTITAYYNTVGTLIIQSMSDDSILIQTCYIYYSTQNETSKLMYYLNNFNSFLLNVTTPIKNYFDIKILFQKNLTDNQNVNITQRIFFEFIPAEVNDNYYEESEIKYRILNEVEIPYYINSTNNFEVIKMKKNFNDIIINNIVVKAFGNNEINRTKYEEYNILKFNDNEYYFEFYYQGKGFRRLYYLEISISLNISNDNNTFGDEIKEFKIIRMEANDLTTIKKNINVSQEPQFYYIDPKTLNNKNKNYDGLILYTRDLKIAVNFHLGIYNYYSYRETLKMEKSFYYIKKESLQDKNNILVLIVYDDIKYKGSIDSLMNDKELYIDNNCNRTKFYNNTEILNGKDEVYYICYTNDAKKYRFSYKISKESSENEIVFSYYNQISNSNNSIEVIFNDSKKNIFDNNFCKMNGKSEILYLKYNIKNGPVILTMQARNYEYIQGENNNGIFYSLSYLFTLLLIIIGIYIYKSKNKRTESDFIISQQLALVDEDEDFLD